MHENAILPINMQKVGVTIQVVTHNTKHFSRIEGIKLEDWTI